MRPSPGDDIESQSARPMPMTIDYRVWAIIIVLVAMVGVAIWLL
jgi:hypothetical protein